MKKIFYALAVVVLFSFRAIAQEEPPSAASQQQQVQQKIASIIGNLVVENTSLRAELEKLQSEISSTKVPKPHH